MLLDDGAEGVDIAFDARGPLQCDERLGPVLVGLRDREADPPITQIHPQPARHDGEGDAAAVGCGLADGAGEGDAVGLVPPVEALTAATVTSTRKP